MDSSTSCPIAYPLVSGLPRGASVEWHMIAVTDQHSVTCQLHGQLNINIHCVALLDNCEVKLESDVLVQTFSAVCTSTEACCIQSSFGKENKIIV